jgi:hypothetical protein
MASVKPLPSRYSAAFPVIRSFVAVRIAPAGGPSASDTRGSWGLDLLFRHW